MIAVRPAVEPAHRMQEMLRALNDRRPARLLGDVDESFDAQKSGAEVLRDPVEQELRFLARQRALARENEILDSPAFEMGTCRWPWIVLVMAMVVVNASWSCAAPDSLRRATGGDPPAGWPRRSPET